MPTGDHDVTPYAPTAAAPRPARDAAASAGVAPTMAAERSGASDAPVVRPGDTLSDRYRVIERIGGGGMGEVFVAEHITIGKRVAIKVLGSAFAHRDKLVERFMQEARAASLIRHEHIVDITDFGFAREGVPYYVMEYLEGESLAARIRREKRLSWPQARAIMLEICDALQAAHENGVIHRDMKPDNCFVIERAADRSFVKVLDFGIAKIITEGTDKELTQTGMVMGTAAYMSPEQAQSLDLDARADIYSAAVILYEMLTGRVPFDGGGFLDILTKHLTERVPSLRKVAPEAEIATDLERVVLRALSKQRDRRFESAAAFAEALASLDERGRAPGRMRRLWPAAAAGVVAFLGLGYFAVNEGSGDAVDGPTPVAAVQSGAQAEPNPDATSTRSRRAVRPSSPTPAREGDRDESRKQELPPDTEQPAVAEATKETIEEPTPASSGTGGEVEQGAEAVAGDTEGGASPPQEEPQVDRAKLPKPPDHSPASSAPSESPPGEPAVVPERLSEDAIRKGVAKAQAKIGKCKEHFELPTIVKVSFTIDPDGRVSSASALPPHGSQTLGRCVADLVRSIQFPAAQHATESTRELDVR